jgi:hypothetical protein
MADQWRGTQRDLFDEPPPNPKLAATERAKVLGQIRLLLMEVMARTADRRGTDNDQDHF